jgi:hypothetical protein
MARQPFSYLRAKYPGGDIAIGTFALGERPKLESIIAKCLMAWPVAESELALTLGQLLGIGSEPALAVFSTLRRSTAQRDAVAAAAEVALKDSPDDLKLLTAMLDVHKSTEAERTALSHGHFGIYDKLPDAILWMTTADYVQLKAKRHLALHAFTEEMKTDLFSRIFVYREDDLAKIYDDIACCAAMWPHAINWLHSHSRQREVLYRQLCEQTRIAQALTKPRRKNTHEVPP